MKGQQLLALCLLACIAGVAFAARQAKDKDADYNYESDYMNKNYGEYGYDDEKDKPSKDDYEYDYGKKPACDDAQFPELAAPTCIDPDSGEPVHLKKYDDEDACEINEKAWCKKVPNTKWGCKYSYKKAGTVCKPANGICDLDDTCTGKSAVCKEVFAPTTKQCYTSTSPCLKNTFCDNKKATCPTPKYAPNGTPCKEDGLYSEAYGEDGKVALQATVSSEVAKKHGWATCQRCFEGKCAAFKFEWWNKKTSKKHSKKNKNKRHSHHDDDEHDDEHDGGHNGGHKKKSYDEDDKKNKYDDKKEWEEKEYKKNNDKEWDEKEDKKNNDKKDDKPSNDKPSGDKPSDDKGKEYEYDEDEYDGEEWYDSKVDYEQYAKLEGYEPEVYCKKMHVKTEDKTA